MDDNLGMIGGSNEGLKSSTRGYVDKIMNRSPHLLTVNWGINRSRLSIKTTETHEIEESGKLHWGIEGSGKRHWNAGKESGQISVFGGTNDKTMKWQEKTYMPRSLFLQRETATFLSIVLSFSCIFPTCEKRLIYYHLLYDVHTF